MSIPTKKVQKKSKSDHSVFRKQKNSKSSSNKQNSSAQDILTLHQTIGNQAVQRLFESGFIQGKLTVGEANDKYEQEADRVADEVMRMPEPQVQRQSEEEEEEMLQTKPIGEQITPLVQRQVEPEEEEEETLQAKSEGQTPQVSSGIESSINALQGGGQSLSEESRTFFEPRFGQDFSKVRVHNDSNANQLAMSINAKAFTKGNDIVFGAGEYSPESSSGKRLLGHELTHVLQQKSNLSRKYLSQKNIGNMTFQNSTAKIQKDPIAIVGLGLAVFGTGKSIATSGRLSSKSTPASYMHSGTPISAKWKKANEVLHIIAWNPRDLFGGKENFYFRLAYEYNGYDIRNATINVLRLKSSGMYASTFDITWSPSKQSQPKDPVAQIIFNISGRWDPWGVGDYSFWGELVISSSLTGKVHKLFTIDSEKVFGGRGVWRA